MQDSNTGIVKILKRDGREVPFNINKISDAIQKAAKKVSTTIDQIEAMKMAIEVVDYFNENNIKSPTVEDIQDIVEKVLIYNGHSKTAKEYILYRAERSKVREMNTGLMKIMEGLTFQSSSENDKKRENGNIDGDTAMGTMLRYGSETSKKFTEMFILDPKFTKAHGSGDIHIHDFDFHNLTTTCCQINLKKLFEDGFFTGYGYIRPPRDIRTYSALACIAIQSNQNDQHGGQGIPNFDFYMADGVKKTYKKLYRNNMIKTLEVFGQEDAEELVKGYMEDILLSENLTPTLANDDNYIASEKSILKSRITDEQIEIAQRLCRKNTLSEIYDTTYQAMEALVHNLNTMASRAGAQVPFSSINYGTDTSPEGQLIIETILLALEAGMGDGETPIWPCHIFKVKEGVNYNEGDPNYKLFKLACKVSAKRMYPNFSFMDSSFNKRYYVEGNPETEVSYMGCRTRVIGNVYDPTREISDGRGNLNYTSINLPRLAILALDKFSNTELSAKQRVDDFFKRLDDQMELVFDQLLFRYKILAQKTIKNFPFLMGQGVWIDADKLQQDEPIGEILKHGTLSLGFIGLAETLTALIGKHQGESEEAQTLGLQIIKFMREKCDTKSNELKMNFTLLATPAEGLSGRFVNIDKKRFGIIPGITDKEYYTNGFHVPVKYKISAAEKIRIEAPYHELTNAGHISYIEMDGDPSDNLEAFEAIIRRMHDSNMGYAAINHPLDRDPVCKFSGVIKDVCPRCGRREDEEQKFHRIRRVTGYLVGTLDRFNNAKRAEEADRIKHV